MRGFGRASASLSQAHPDQRAGAISTERPQTPRAGTVACHELAYLHGYVEEPHGQQLKCERDFVEAPRRRAKSGGDSGIVNSGPGIGTVVRRYDERW